MTAWITPEFMQRLAGSLLHFLWQGAAIALFAVIVLRLLSRRSAELRYVISVLSLLAMFLAPVLTFVFYAETGAVALRLLKVAGDVLAESGSAQLPNASIAIWTQWIVVAWFSGVFACSFRLAAGWRLSHELIRSAHPLVPQTVVEIFESIRGSLVSNKTVRLLVSTRIDTPAVVGWLRPAILLPVSAITGLSDEQLRSVLAHELAHIRRHDFLVNMLQRCVESVLFYHPAVWWLSARVRAERENCCDDLAVKICGDRLTYAEALIELERLRPDAPPALVVAATGSGLVLRVRRILGRPTASQDWQSAIAAFAFVLAWMIVGALQAQPIPAPPQTLAAIALPVLAPPIEPSTLSIAAASIAAILTAQPAEPVAVEPEPEPAPQGAQVVGTIEGTVTANGQPLSNAQVTLSGGPVNIANMSKTIDNLWATAQVPPDSWDAVMRTYYTDRGMTAQQANQQLNKVQITGFPASPDNGQLEDELFSRMMSYNNTNFGISPYNSEFTSSLKAFRAGNAKYKMVTDRGGRFSFRDVPAGDYTVRVERDGYFGKPGSSLVPQTGSVKVKVAGGTNTIEVPMIRGAVISGRVRDELGLPLANTMVQAFAVAYSNGLPSLRAAAANKTNDRGEYSIFWLPGGEYYIAAIKASTQVVGNGGLLQQVVGTFYPGTPLVTQAVTVNVKTGANLDGIDFVHRPVKTIRISGTVSTTIPVPDPAAQGARGGRGAQQQQSRQAVLMLLQRDPNAPDDIGARQVGTVAVDIARGTGTFELEVSPGSYDLFGRMPTPGGAINATFGRVGFDARDTDLKGLSMSVAPPPSLSGIVTIDGNAPGETPIKVSVQVDDSGAKLPAYGIQVRSRTNAVNPDGTFLIPAVFAGHWQIFIEGLSPTMYVADVRQGGVSVYDSGITAAGEPLNALQVLVRKDGGTVTGVVVDNEKKPIPNASVVLVPPDNRRQNRQLYKAGNADASGRFTLTGVAPGTYKLFAWSPVPAGLFSVPIPGAYFSPKYMARYESFGRPVSVAPAGSVNSDINAAPLD